jgi:uncharacterized protein (DUF849 family)
MRKIWIEAALNGAWTRAYQPGIPDTVAAIIEEGIACAKAGAAIVHMHAYDGGGAQTFDWQVYARIIEGIRRQVDALVYPSYPAVMVSGTGEGMVKPEGRFEHIEALAARGLIDFALIDPGSVNFTLAGRAAATRPADTYINPEAHVQDALAFAARVRLPPNFAIYEPGFARAGAALARAAGTMPPLYRLMFSETFAVGFPPKPYGLSAYLSLLEEFAGGAPWMIAGFSADVRPLIGETVARGGHVRVGLEDAPLGSKKSNVIWVEDAVRLVRQHGGEPASAVEVRRDLQTHAAGV